MLSQKTLKKLSPKRQGRRKENEDKKSPASNNQLLGLTLLLVNTGSAKKKFVITKLKKLGIKIIALNKEKNWVNGGIDYWIIADTANYNESVQQVGRFLKEHPRVQLDGVITFEEEGVVLTSKLIDKYNLPGIPLVVAKLVSNKYLFREFCRQNNLPTIKYQVLRSDNDLKQIVKNFSFPLVIKPVYGTNSSFVIKVDDEDSLKDSYNYIKKSVVSRHDNGITDDGDILVEEYIDGDEVDVDLLIQNGRIKFCSLSDTDKEQDPFFVEDERSTPCNLPVKNQEEIMELADQILERFGIQNGCVHLEVKSTITGPVPIEINLHMNREVIYVAIKNVWKVDLIEYAVKIASGRHFAKIELPENPCTYIISHSFSTEDSGSLLQLELSPEIERKEYIEGIKFFKKIGDPVLVPPEGYDELGWIIISGENFPDAEDNLQEALEDVHYEVAKFQPTSSIGQTVRKNPFSYSILNKNLILGRSKIEKIRRMSRKDQRDLHIGIACNIFSGTAGSVEQDLANIGSNIEKVLKKRGYRVTFFDFNNLTKVFNDLAKADVDLVFNVCERINGSSLLEPHAAALLDTLQIPYTGSNPFTLGLCIDKIRVKKLLSYHKIPTPKWDYVYTLEDEISDELKYPMIVKPSNTDNSIGITNDSVVANKKDLMAQLRKVIIDIGRPALIEEYIEGDEYDVSILGSRESDLRALPLSRSIFNQMPKGYWHIYPFEAKWDNHPIYDKKITVQKPPKNIDKKLEALITEVALDTYKILDCHDYGRVELRVDSNGNPYVLELNPNPSINIGDSTPKCAELVGLDYGDFIEEVINMAINRYKNNPPYSHLQSHFNV